MAVLVLRLGCCAGGLGVPEEKTLVVHVSCTTILCALNFLFGHDHQLRYSVQHSHSARTHTFTHSRTVLTFASPRASVGGAESAS